MSDVIELLGMGPDPLQWSWAVTTMTPEDYFKFPASHPRLSLLKQGVEELMLAGSWDDDDVRKLVQSLTQRVTWTTLESTEAGLEIAFGARDDEAEYSYSVVIDERKIRRAEKALEQVRS